MKNSKEVLKPFLQYKWYLSFTGGNCVHLPVAEGMVYCQISCIIDGELKSIHHIVNDYLCSINKKYILTGSERVIGVKVPSHYLYPGSLNHDPYFDMVGVIMLISKDFDTMVELQQIYDTLVEVGNGV